MGPDLEAVAAHAKVSAEEVMARRANPRREVPAGSVGIGGAQTGVYPHRSPGGWHIIGRTDLALFSLEADPPALLQAGDRVRFVVSS